MTYRIEISSVAEAEADSAYITPIAGYVSLSGKLMVR